MSEVTYVKQQKAKATFIGLYVLSIALIFIVAVAFRKSQTAPSLPAKTQSNTAVAGYFLQADTLLHQKLKAFDDAYAAYLNGDKKDASRDEMNAANSVLKNVLDSMDNVSQTLTDESQKQVLNLVINNFNKTVDNNNAILRNLSSNNIDKKDEGVVTEVKNEDNNEVQGLKQLLAEKENKMAALESQRQQDLQEKEKQIASLQNQLKQKDNSTSNNSPAMGSEWKQKYDAINANYERALARENDLKTAYKTIVEDNRRLLNQIQSLKGNR